MNIHRQSSLFNNILFHEKLLEVFLGVQLFLLLNKRWVFKKWPLFLLLLEDYILHFLSDKLYLLFIITLELLLVLLLQLSKR